ncbi:MAG: hypothetical protein V2J11_01990 [Desulfofustis sp.]|jgi:hypothetical protein|nr:hypothetical protein [Desulfofustis sp.]
MDRFKSIMGHSWFFTREAGELPEAVRNRIAERTGLDFVAETILAVCFTRTVVNPARLFVVVTRERIVVGKTGLLQEISFSNLRGVERGFLQDIVLRLRDGEFALFAYPEMPKTECMDLLYEVIAGRHAGVTGDAA